MTVTSGFFNSLDGDRKYDASQMSDIFTGIIKDGVIAGIGTCFNVTASSGMTVLVGIGRGWFNGIWIKNDAAYPITLEDSHPTLDRIDTIVIDIDNSDGVRAGTIQVLKGTPAATPVAPGLTESVDHNNYAIANIRVGKAVGNITQNKITSLIGTANCPYVTGLLKTLTTDQITLALQEDFNEWFETVRGQLSGDIAGNLATQIADLSDLLDLVRKTGDIRILSAITSAESKGSIDGYYPIDKCFIIKLINGNTNSSPKLTLNGIEHTISGMPTVGCIDTEPLTWSYGQTYILRKTGETTLEVIKNPDYVCERFIFGVSGGRLLCKRWASGDATITSLDSFSTGSLSMNLVGSVYYSDPLTFYWPSYFFKDTSYFANLSLQGKTALGANPDMSNSSGSALSYVVMRASSTTGALLFRIDAKGLWY